MKMPLHSNDGANWFIGELTSRIVAESGIPSDRYHLGKIILQSLKDAPDFLLQIDGGRDEKETNRSALERTVRCANAMKATGIKLGDVVVMMAPNHIDLAIPYYAGLYIGAIGAPADKTMGAYDIRIAFHVNRPRIVFCQSEKAPVVQLVVNELKLDTLIVTFDKCESFCSFSEFLERGTNGLSVNEFKPTDFDPEHTLALLMSTSGTTGLPKSAMITHKNVAITLPCSLHRFYEFPTPTQMLLVLSPLQWLSGNLNYILSPIFRCTRLQSSLEPTRKHIYHLFNTYRPTSIIVTPALITLLLYRDDGEQCDMTCLDQIIIGGSAIPEGLIEAIKKMLPETDVVNLFGMTEVCTAAFQYDDPPVGSCGNRMGCFQYRLVNYETKEDILEPHVSGELWLKGPSIFKGYYNDPQSTADTFAEDGWFKSGDIFYRDENWNYYHVERMKSILRYKSISIAPAEIEGVIRQHPGVFHVAVTGIPDGEGNDLATACVVRRPGHSVTAQEIKDLVKESLADIKHLRGGVIFLNELPLTASTKVNIKKLKEIALAMDKL